MIIPMETWDVCFNGNYCFCCGKERDLIPLPSVDNNIFQKYCISCETIYIYNWKNFFENTTVPLPDHFKLPSIQLLNQLKKKFN